MPRAEKSVYEIAGGDETFRQLVNVFYARIEQDTSLRPMFPADLEPGKRWQYLFLVQYFGGPAVYAEERGHPRLRMRHMPFPIDAQARAGWLRHMLAAIDVVSIPEPARSTMRDYFERASEFMVNTVQPGEQGEG